MPRLPLLRLAAIILAALLGAALFGADGAQPLPQMPQAGRLGTGAPPAPVTEPMSPEPLQAPKFDPPIPSTTTETRNTDIAELIRRCQAGNVEACASVADKPDANTVPLPPR